MRLINFNQPPHASKEMPRYINRRLVLNLIRSEQPVSRADLARRSGLQRSTVSLIIEELIGDHWVMEEHAVAFARGRRPTYLRVNDKRAVVCVDIRPSQITFGIGKVNGEFAKLDSFPNTPNASAALTELGARIRELVKARPEISFEGVGISLPGRIDLATNQLVFAPNLKWPVIDLKQPLEQATGLEVEIENAANACALSETWFGAGGEIRDLVAVTVSEGIGTGIVVQGHLITGRRGMAGEFGHVPLQPDGPSCSCGNRGCWEVMASNRAALRYYFQSGAQPPAHGDFTFVDLLHLAETGDVLATRALHSMATQIGRGTRMIVAGLAPEAILFIGEFTALWRRFQPVIQAEVQAQSISPEPTVLLAARDGAMARARGTIALVLQKHFAPPVLGVLPTYRGTNAKALAVG